MTERTLRNLKKSAQLVRDYTLQRDIAIRAARAEGYSLREVAAWTGLSHSAIAKIEKREQA